MNRESFFLLCLFNWYIMSLFAMEESLEKAKENTIASICKHHEDPCKAFIEIEKQCSPSLQSLTNFLSVAEFSKHIRTLLHKMRTIVLTCASGNPEEVLLKTVLTQLAPLMQEFLLRRYSATYDWQTESRELADEDYEYLRMRKRDSLSPNRMRVSFMPNLLTVTFDGKQILSLPINQKIFFKRDGKDMVQYAINQIIEDRVKSYISKTNTFVVINYESREKKAGEILFLSATRKYEIMGPIRSLIGLPKAHLEKKQVEGEFLPNNVHISFSENDEFLCLLSRNYIFLINLSTMAVRAIGRPLLANKVIFSKDATNLCIFSKYVYRGDGAFCLIIDTCSMNVLVKVTPSYPFFKHIYISPVSHSLIFKEKDSYQLYKKTYQVHYLFKCYCAYLLEAQRKRNLKENSTSVLGTVKMLLDPLLNRSRIDEIRASLLRSIIRNRTDGVNLSITPSTTHNTESINDSKKNANTDTKCKSYLSIDAVGMHALIVVDMLMQLEEYLGGPLAKHFDVITGSGFGAVVGLGLVASLDGIQPLISLSALRDTFAHQSSYIFSASQRAEIKPFYNNKNLGRVIRGIFHKARLSDALTQFALPIQIKNSSIQPFSYTRDRACTREIDDIYLAELALYATADTQFFPAIETKHYTCPQTCIISASEVYKDNGAQYIYDEYMSGAAESTMRLLSISPHLSSEAAQRTHNLFKQRLGLQNYMHLHADRSDIVKEPDNCLPQVLDSYASASENICQKSEGFLRKLLDNKSS